MQVIRFLFQEIQERDVDATCFALAWAALESNQVSLRHLIYSQARFHIRYTDPYYILKNCVNLRSTTLYSLFIRLPRKQV